MFLSVFLILSTVSVAMAALWPDTENKGQKKKDGALEANVSHLEEGYILVRGGKTSKRLKLRVTQGEHSVMYDLNNKNEFEVLPLQFGNGKYRLNLYKQVSGSRYTEEGVISMKVEMPDVNRPFLYPNQYINYTPENKAVQKADELCAGLQTGREKYKAITEYVTHAFVYDFVRAVTTKGDGLPDVDYCFNRGMGICQDLAATSVCMLRSQGVPAKLVIGNASGQYHAWVQATVDGEEKLFDPTAILLNMPQPIEYAVERWY
jgi:transglutaminase-like putative cysteine protease